MTCACGNRSRVLVFEHLFEPREEAHTLREGPPLGARHRLAAVEPVLLDVAEVAARLGVGRSFVYELLQHGDLEYCKLGARTKIPIDAVDGYVQRRLAVRRAETAAVLDELERRRRRRG